MILEHGREPLIRYPLHGEYLYDPFVSFLVIVGPIFGRLRLPQVGETVELWRSAAVTSTLKSREDERWYLGIGLLGKIHGVRRRRGGCEQGNMEMDIRLGRNQGGQIGWQGDMGSVVRCGDDHRIVVAAFFLGINCPNVIRGPFYANHLVQR